MTLVAARVKRLRAGESLVRRSPVWYRSSTRLFDRLERASLDERRAWIEARLDTVLAAARRTAYGSSVGAPVSVHDWPVLEEDCVRASPSSFVRGDTRLASHAATSGTTGVPLEVWRSFRSVAVEQAAIDRLVARLGVRFRTSKVAVLRGDDIKDPGDRSAPFWTLVGGGRRLVFSSNHLGEETVADFAAALKRFEPDVLYAYPTSVEFLCHLLQRSGQTLAVPIVLCSSESVSERTWRLVAEVLGSRLVDYYGLAERVAFAYAYQPERYLFLPGYSHNELLPCGRDGDADDVYEIVATGLWNLKMPLVRFRTGDLVRLSRGSDPTSVSYGVDAFLGVVGRSGDYLIAPDGAHLMGIDHIPRGIRDVARMQVIQERRDVVRILVVPVDASTRVDVDAILANATRKLPPTMSISVEVRSDLERGAGGKVPFVIRSPAL